MFWKKKPTSTAAPADDNDDDKQTTPKMARLHRFAKQCGQGMLQRLAMKKVMSMDPKEREKLMQKALAPENISKNKDKILEAMEQMKASGQLTDDQMKTVKEKLGLQ